MGFARDGEEVMAIEAMAIEASTSQDIQEVNVLTNRVNKRKQECNDAPREILFQRARSLTNSWKETEADPNRLRWGKAFVHILEESAIVIRDGELIVGSETKSIRGAEIVPECSPYDVLSALEQRTHRTMSEVMMASMDPDEEGIKEVANYWVGRSVNDIVYRAWQNKMGDSYTDLIDGRKGKTAILPDVNGTVYKTQTIYNPRIMKDGLSGIIRKAKEEKKKTISSAQFVSNDYTAIFHKTVILDVMVMTCEALIRFARKHADLAVEMAKTERDPVRKQELMEIAETCVWVPENPPRTFREALQFYWFIHLGIRKEAPYHSGPCPARMDQWLYPYYKKDLESGGLSRQEAAELLGLVWVKLNEMQNVSGSYFEKEAAGSLLQQVTLGGATLDGMDATNDLSYLILEVAQQMKMPQPGIYIRFHNRIDHDFMVKAIETNRETRGGIPAFLNDRIAIRNFLATGYAYEDAVEWSAAGCLSYVVSHCNLASKIAAYIIVPKVLEVALNNGVDPRTGMKVGKETGDVTKFAAMEQLYEAFWTQYDHFVEKGATEYWVGYSSKVEHLGTPLTSILIEDCLTRGLDVYEGGERYPEMGVCFGQRGCVDVADAFAAIKKLVFDEQKVTMAQLLTALKANWDGYEDIYRLCLQAPKYGNDDDYVDDIFNYVSLKCNEIILSKPNPCTGRPWRVSRPALTGHYPAGEVTGALPNGRKATMPLYDASLSPMIGADVNGPTALIKSATKADHIMPYMDSMVLNMKLSPSMLQTRPSIEKVLSLLKTFFDRGGWHIQFNITSREDLLEAKKNPEQWRHLIVRVAGYSAYFVDLPPAVQDEIVGRTEHGL
jgi:pyruvate formate-lyase/glycerol dehydratase family glycyl radical enzyme